MLDKAQEFMDAGRFAEAEALFREVLDQSPGNTEAVYLLAVARHRQGAVEEALELMARAAGQDPDNAHIVSNLGAMQMSARRIDDARHSYLKALQINPVLIEAHKGLAFVEISSGNFRAAENAANLALAENPVDAQALMYMGTAKLEQGEHEKAISYLTEALKENPEHQAAQMLLGRAFLNAGNHGFAEQCFRNVVEADDRAGPAWEHLGLALAAGGFHQDAALSFRKAVDCGIRKPSVIRAMAESLRQAGQEELATQVLENFGVQGGPASEKDLVRARSMLALGRPAEALQILEPHDGLESDVIKVAAFEQMRNWGQALALVEDHARSPDADDELRLTYARLLAKSGKGQASEAIIDGLLSREEPPVQAQIFRGFQMCRNDDEAGLDLLKSVLERNGLQEVDLRRVNRMLANTLDRLGRFEEAAEHYRALSGRLAQAMIVAGGVATENRDLAAAADPSVIPARHDDPEFPADPVFLLAWPGSGWEWLTAGFNAHPSVMLVADHPETQIRRRALIGTAVSSMSRDDATQAVRNYWNDLAGGQLLPGDRQTVDSMWISADMLPSLAAIFPHARVVVVNRNPARMALEWFRAGYGELGLMAESFRDQQAALAGYRQWLPLPFIDVDGDALIENPVREFRSLSAELGLEWAPAIEADMDELRHAFARHRGSVSDYADAIEAPLGILGAAGDGA